MCCIVDQFFNFGKPKTIDENRDVVKLHAEEVFRLAFFSWMQLDRVMVLEYYAAGSTCFYYSKQLTKVNIH